MLSQQYGATRPGHGGDGVVQALEGLDAQAARVSRLEAVKRYLGLRKETEGASDGRQ